MPEPSSEARESQASREGPEPKRRKVRKGTQSCWECKKRKIRCKFSPPENSSCDGCNFRGAACISQEFSDEPAPVAASGPVIARLSRVESLVEKLVHKSDLVAAQNTISKRPATSHIGPQTVYVADAGHEAILQPSPRSSVQGAAVSAPTEQATGKLCTARYSEVSRALIAAWPSEGDLDIISTSPVAVVSLLHAAALCTPYSTITSQDAPVPGDVLQLPPSGSHPVLTARKLLLLGTYLPGLSPANPIQEHGINQGDIMCRAVETACRLVTSNDELVDSIEGVECLMIEGMYYNYAGNLRRAWLAIRRAILMAQMMGLHRGANAHQVKMIDTETRKRVNLEYMWFRLLHTDRYLSLMLGLPQASVENAFATPRALDACTPIERLERLDSVAASRILQRNAANIHDLAATEEIDRVLQKASAYMSAKWWLAPDLRSSSGDAMEAFRETIRFTDQITHYNLLAQLHLPYLLCPSADRRYDYSKITAVNACRELLARFVAFRSLNPPASYCRGIDFVAFIASTALCLAHMDAHGRPSGFNQKPTDGARSIFGFLAHQRLSDRGMMEQTLESMEDMARAGEDAIVSKISWLLRQLLDMENDAASGTRFNTSSSSDGDLEKGECSGNVSDGGKVLRLHIPYFGTVKIEHGGVSRSTALPTPSETNPPAFAGSVSVPNSMASVDKDPNMTLQDQQPETSTNVVVGHQLGRQAVNPDWDAGQLNHTATVPPEHSVPTVLNTDGGFAFLDGAAHEQDAQPFMPGMAADVDDWALQGVDMAFFDNLIRGASLSDILEEQDF